MPIDIERARRETPGCTSVLHFNNAGSSLMPECVLNAQIEHLQREAQMGGYEAADAASAAVDRVYDAAAELIGASRDEIAAIENATRAWDMAFYSIRFKPGDRILTAKAEYASNYIAYLQVAQKHGVSVEVVPNDELGQLSIEHLQAMIDDRVRLISVTHIPTNGGLVNPVAEIGAVAKQAGVLYLVDACQSVGQMPVDVDVIGCDMLSTTGRKYLRGPRGSGFLYVRRRVLEQLDPVMLDLHAAQWVSQDAYTVRSDARKFENWETNYAAKIGLGVAIDYALSWGMESIWERVQDLAGALRTGLSAIPGVTVRDIGAVQGGIVTFTIEGQDLSKVKDALASQAINVTVSRTPSTRLDMEERGLSEVIRASVHYYNDESEVARFCESIEALA